MKKEVLDFVVEKTHDLMKASTSSEEVKSSAQAWLDTVGTEKEVEETKKYMEALEENIVPIDDLINMAASQPGIQYFGAETAKKIETHAEDIKKAGAVYCDCPACSAAEAILKRKEEVLK